MRGRKEEPGTGYGSRRRYDGNYRPAHDNRYQKERRKPSRYQKRGANTSQAIREMMPSIRKFLELSVDHNRQLIDAQTRRSNAEERSAASMETIARILNHLFFSATSPAEK